MPHVATAYGQFPMPPQCVMMLWCTQVLFAIEGILCKLQQHASDLPWRDELSLAPILEFLSIDSIILLFTAVLLEER